MYTRKEKFRVSIGTWNINGDKNPALEDQYPAILDAWILDGPENISLKNRKDKIIPTIGLLRSILIEIHRSLFFFFFQVMLAKIMLNPCLIFWQSDFKKFAI